MEQRRKSEHNRGADQSVTIAGHVISEGLHVPIIDHLTPHGQTCNGARGQVISISQGSASTNCLSCGNSGVVIDNRPEAWDH